MSASSEPTNRPTFMMVLHDLKELRIKACYYNYCEKATVSELRLEYAVDDQMSLDSIEYAASSVEVCQCPSPYSGLSCQVHFLRILHIVSSVSFCIVCEFRLFSKSCFSLVVNLTAFFLPLLL